MRRSILSISLLLALGAAAHADPDIAKGEQAFKKCAPCHMVGPDAKVKVGPPLNGIVGASWAHYADFNYSDDLKAGAKDGKVWDEATLDAYIANPKAVAPQGRMPFAGIKPAAERENLIAYLKQFDASGAKK